MQIKLVDCIKVLLFYSITHGLIMGYYGQFITTADNLELGYNRTSIAHILLECFYERVFNWSGLTDSLTEI